jgi:hypothetical protein
MKKSVTLIVVVVIIVAAAVGGYLFVSHKNNTKTPIVTNSNQASTPKTVASKQLDLTTLLANLQKQYPTVQKTYVYSQSQDPNGNLGKAGYYTAGAEFYDTRTNTAPDGTAFGADSGGAIEVYSNSSDAAKRITYYQQFQGNPTLDPGAVKQVGDVVVRASSQYNATDQKQMIDYLVAQVQSLTQ